jgi:hypothetical protein
LFLLIQLSLGVFIDVSNSSIYLWSIFTGLSLRFKNQLLINFFFSLLDLLIEPIFSGVDAVLKALAQLILKVHALCNSFGSIIDFRCEIVFFLLFDELLFLQQDHSLEIRSLFVLPQELVVKELLFGSESSLISCFHFVSVG